MQKILFGLCALILTAQFALGQSTPNCTPLFSGLANHSIQECTTREFDKLDIYTKDKSNGYTSGEKKGEYMKVNFSFDGDFQKYAKNLTLSRDRANAVVNELVAKYGVNKNQLIAEGVSSLSPVAPNITEEGKAKNRRVEIVLQ